MGSKKVIYEMDSSVAYNGRLYDSYTLEEKVSIYHLFLAKKSIVSTQRAYRKLYGLQTGAPSNKHILRVIQEFTMGLNQQTQINQNHNHPGEWEKDIKKTPRKLPNLLPISSESFNIRENHPRIMRQADLLFPVVQIKEDPDMDMEICEANEEFYNLAKDMPVETEPPSKRQRLQDPLQFQKIKLEVSETTTSSSDFVLGYDDTSPPPSPLQFKVEEGFENDVSSETIMIRPSTSIFATPEDNDEEESWACDSCEKIFPDKNSLQNHIQNGCETEAPELEASSPGSILGFQDSPFITSLPLSIIENNQNQEENINQIRIPKKPHLKRNPKSISYDNSYLEQGANLPKQPIPTNIKCIVCSQYLDTRAALHLHYSTLHPEERPHICSICGKNYQANRYLREHMLTHTEKTLKCEICGKMYHLQRRLKAHLIKTHKLQDPNSMLPKNEILS